MKRYILIFLIAAVPVTAGLVSCSDSESRMNSVLNQATVVINLAMPEEHTSVSFSITERIFHFFIRDAVAQTAPAAFSSIQVRVTGSDLTPIEKNFNPGAAISFSVPAGTVRTFEVTAVVAPGDPSAAASFRGTSVANLPAGATVNVPVAMRLNDTKIIVPDYYNNRLLVFDSVSGSYSSKQGTDFIGDYNIIPYDIDFDARGRMFISDHYNFQGFCIIRANSFSLSDPNIPLRVNVGVSPNAIAVDRVNNIVYYTDNTNLYRRTLDLTPLASMSNDIIGYIHGLDVAPDGILYIAGENTTYVPGIFKYNVNTGMVESFIDMTTIAPLDVTINTPYDIQVKYPYLYVLTPQASSSDYNILKLKIGLNEEITLVGNGPSVSITDLYGALYNVGHFTSLFSNGLLMMGKYPNKLFFMNDESGAGWQENTGNINDPFNFFDYGGGG